ncbi:MAG: iron-sulfur cluster assembly accessory protein [Merismopedia sp. SIO2A8]|nr:iron-sulfur cluster assembly accessory protein [Merismopedia sp. SIO2A8]
MIRFTAEAIREIKRLSKQHNHDLSHEKVRVGIQAGRCADFAYLLSYAKAFETTKQDQTIDYGDFTAIISCEHTEQLKGVTIDYSEDLMGGAFRYLNPNATYTCDCGNSFSVTPQPIPPAESTIPDEQ